MNNQEKEKLQALARQIDRAINPNGGQETGFILITFRYDADGLGRYVASCSSDDTIILMRQLIDNLEQRTKNERHQEREYEE